MTITLFSRCEGSTFDATHDYSAGDTTWSASGSPGPSFSSTNPKVGTNCILIPEIANYFALASASIVTPGEGCVGFWLRVESWQDGGIVFNAYLSTQTSRYIRATLVGTDEMRLAIRNPDAGPAVELSTNAANLTTAAYFFILFRWRDAGGENDREISVYNSSLTLLQTVTDLATAYEHPGSIDTLAIGDLGAAGGTYRVDNLFVGNSWDDAADILANANITSWTEFGGGEAITGTGAVTAAGVQVAGSGVRGAEGTGAVAGSSPQVAGSGTAFSPSSGTGSLAPTSAVATGAAIRGVQDLGSPAELSSQTPLVAASATRGVEGSGALTGAAVQVAGVGSVSDAAITGTGALVGPVAEIQGEGNKGLVGFGALVVQPAETDGSGSTNIDSDSYTGTGVLTVPAALIAGSGIRRVAGAGTVLARKPVIRAVVAVNGEYPSSAENYVLRRPLRSVLRDPLRKPQRAA